ncbi:MAG: hypothetical protein ACI9UA_001406 [Pseudoalteromonas tetraodonis]|jgi:hypothetical protein
MKVLTPILAAGALFTFQTVGSAALVAWYPLDGDANDASGNGYNGSTIGTGVTHAQAGANAATGQSTDFSGAGHIDVPWNAALNSQDFTVTLWANADAAGGSFRSPISNRDDVAPGGVNRHGWIVYNDNAGNWSFWNGGGLNTAGGWNVANAGAVTTNAWNHIAISYDSVTNTKEFYLNGALVSTTNPIGFSPNDSSLADGLTHEDEDMHIGGGGDAGTSFRWDGRLDDVTIWNTALSGAEIDNIRLNSVPEPAALVLIGGAGVGLILRRRRR